MSETQGDPGLAAFARTLRLPLAELPDPLPMTPIPSGSVFDASVTPPGSKSLTNRALLLAGLATGESVLRGALIDADDAQVMLAALRRLGAAVDTSAGEVRVRGVGGRWRVGAGGAVIHLENAGTATRFLAAAALAGDGPVTIDGSARMRERPIGGLADALEQLGARVEFLGKPGCPPLRITPPSAGGAKPTKVRLRGGESSQFLSALLLVGPFLEHGVRVVSEAPPPSAPYVDMTLRLLRRLGAHDVGGSTDFADVHVGSSVSSRLGPFKGFTVEIEPDASGATYFWAAAALRAGCACAAPGLGRESLQGDVRFAAVLARMGARIAEEGGAVRVAGPARGGLINTEFDMADMPDAAMTLAAVAALSAGPARITGLATLKVKETDRLSALATELSRAGAGVRAGADFLEIEPGPARAGPIEFETYKDHRMAMSLALIGMACPGVAIRDPGCVAKTYPRFWADLGGVYSACRSAAVP